MDNFFKKENKSQANLNQKQIQLKQNQLSLSKQIQNKQAQSSRNLLYEDFINNNDQKNNFKRSLIEGTIPLINPDLHCFRDRNKESELEKYGGVRVKNFMLAKDRAQLRQTIFQENFLQRDIFNNNLPHKNHNYWLRERNMAHEKQEMRFGPNNRTENENLQQSINKTKLDLATVDTKMIYVPDWKPLNKQKWVAGQFQSQNCTFRGKRSLDDSWQMMPLNSSQPDKYIQGFQVLGDQQTIRQRNKQLELKAPEFISQVKKDVWKDTLQTSKSIRTYMQDTNLNSTEMIDIFSKSNNLKNYKNTLVQTKSVDHLVPFKHSNNLRGKEMTNLRPVFDKIYKNSVTKMLDLSSINQSISQQQLQISVSDPITQQDENKLSFKIDKQQNLLQSFNTIKNDGDSDISSIPEKVIPKMKYEPQNHKNYLPWEMPPQSEVSQVVSKYFAKPIALFKSNDRYTKQSIK